MLMIMKRKLFMMAMLLMVAGLTYGQNIIRDYAPHTKRGELPPAWIKNKVTPAQYDSLARVSKYYWVNYDYFKRRDLTKDDIRDYVRHAGTMLSEKRLQRLKKAPTDTCYYDVYHGAEYLKPFMTTTTANGDKELKFIVYSEVDGYDAHVMVEVRVQHGKNGSPVFSGIQAVPYSISGLKVELEDMDIHTTPRASSFVTSNGVYDTSTVMPEFGICGLLKFEDAKGYRHTELVNKRFCLSVE